MAFVLPFLVESIKGHFPIAPNSGHIFPTSSSYSNLCSPTQKIFEKFIVADTISIEYSIEVTFFSIEYSIKLLFEVNSNMNSSFIEYSIEEKKSEKSDFY